MAYFVFHRDSGGAMVSEGERNPGNLPAGISAVDVSAKPDWATHRWNPSTLAIEARPDPMAALSLAVCFAYDPDDATTEKTDFDATEEIGLQVTLKDGEGTTVDYTGTRKLAILKRDCVSGEIMWQHGLIGFTFSSGVATVTYPAQGSGCYGFSAGSSNEVSVQDYWIEVIE